MIGMISAHSRICRWMFASHASPPCSSLRSIQTSMPVSRSASQTANATAMSSLVYDKKTALGDELDSASDIGVAADFSGAPAGEQANERIPPEPLRRLRSLRFGAVYGGSA